MKYRPEIDGIRALAVLPVVLFHAGIPGMAGGFVGVDVFFVISGFLITRILIDELEAGSFSLGRFYARRVRRLLPAFLIVLAATAAASAWISTPTDWVDFAKHMLASLLFLGNVHSWLSSGYFEQAAAATPLLHVWSLAVEEQFYLLFPCLVLAIWTFRKRWLGAALLFLLSGSFGLAVWASEAYPTAAYFLMPFRAWELLVGACAVLLDRRYGWTERAQHADAPGWMGTLPHLGLLLILMSMALLDRGSVYPGWNTLPPVIGTALLLLFCHRGGGLGLIFSSRWVTWLGLLSYSWYLWHQPMLALYRQWILGDPPLMGLMAVILFSLLLAAATYAGVERPIRRAGQQTGVRGRIHAVVLAGSLGMAVLAVLIHRADGFPGRYPDQARIEADRALQSITRPCDASAVSWRGAPPNCHLPSEARSGPPDVLLLGDSHADAILPAFVEMARRHSMTVAYVGQGACPSLIGVDVAAGYWPAGHCQQLADHQLGVAEELRPRTVVLVGRWGMYLDNQRSAQSSKQFYLIDAAIQTRDRESSRRVFTDGLARTVQAYRQLGAEVVLLEQVPLQPVDPGKFYLRLSARNLYGTEASLVQVNAASASLSDAERIQQTLRLVLSGLPLSDRPASVRPQSFMCPEGHCRFADAGGALYFDRDHVSARGAVQMAEPLYAAIREALAAGSRQTPATSN